MPEQRDGWAKAEVISKIISALFLPIVLLWLGTWISMQQKNKDDIRASEESNAARVTTMLTSLSSDNSRERLLAVKVTEYFGKHDQLPKELVPALLEISAKDPNKEVSDSAFQSLTAVANANKDLGPTIQTALRALPESVYIQIASETQREKARQIEQKLRNRGLQVPGIENVSGKADIPEYTSVRFFQQEDEKKAEEIKILLRSNGFPQAEKDPVSARNARPGSLEIWFAKND